MPHFESLDELAEFLGIDVDDDMEWYDTLADKLMEEASGYQELDDGTFYIS